MLGRRLVLSAAIALMFGASAQADVFTFDFDGAGGNAPVAGVTGLDYQAGNILAVGSTPLVPGNTFTSYYQASLGTLLGPSVGLPAGREVTIVARVNEQVASFNAITGTATFNVLGGAFNIYAGAKNADNLAGTGFNDGTLIMSGTFGTGGINNFTFANGVLVPFDQNPPDDYGGKQALFGIGGFLVNSTVDSFDPNYFIIGANQQFAAGSFNGNTQSFFNTIDPSKSFAGAGYGSAPNLGGINGVTGPDSQFLIDSNQFFTFQEVPPPPSVPEPTSLAVFALVLGAGAMRARKGRRQPVA